MGPMISIIVPIYNAESSIDKCIQSILDQSYQNFELILVNDGSTDHSGKVCDDYKVSDQRVIVKHKPNGGVSSARNVGLDLVQGKYIMFVDSDDWIEKGALEIIHQSILSCNSDALIFGIVKSLVSDHKVIKSELNGLYKQGKINIKELVNNFIYYLNSVGMQPSWMYVFKSDIIEGQQLKFNENSVLYEDFDFNLRYLKCCHVIKFIPNALYHYQVCTTVDQLAKRKKENIVPDISAVCHSLLDLLYYHDAKEDVMKQAYAYMLPMYTLCLKNIVIHKQNTTLNDKFTVFKQLQNDTSFNTMMTEYGITLQFYKTLDKLIEKQLYLLAYYLLLYKFKK